MNKKIYPARVWHYATEEMAEQIHAVGVLQWNRQQDADDTQLNTVLFSSDSRWDSTLLPRVVSPNGDVRGPTLEEVVAQGHSVYRFGVPRASLISWSRFWRRIGPGIEGRRHFEKHILKGLFNPEKWFISPEPIKVADCRCQHFAPDGRWRNDD